ncbi:MAG: DUF3179 domain-containing protein [Nitrospirae bacterium]|nr:DUF3179 domain-containing protein [Nitrospirota bacterium]
MLNECLKETSNDRTRGASWLAAAALCSVFTACEGSSASKPFAYPGPFDTCQTLAMESARSPLLNAIPSGFEAEDSEGNRWDFWGRAKGGGVTTDADSANDILVPYDKGVVSSWFAWNTVWPTAGVWSREAPEQQALRSEDYFNADYTESEHGTGLQFFVGKDNRRVKKDLFDPNSPDQNPITRACFDEKDCIPSLVTGDTEGSLWTQCTERPGLDEQGRPQEPDRYPCNRAQDEVEEKGEKKKRYFCCGWDETSPPYCCDAVDLPRYSMEMTKLTPEQIRNQVQAEDNDHLRVKKWYMRETDLVFGLLVGDQPRAYPLKIIWWHEVINDSFEGGDPYRKIRFSLAYSTLTDSVEIFDTTDWGDPEQEKGSRALSLGITGFALNINHILYDRLTESWWSPIRFQTLRGLLRSEEPGNVKGCPLPYVETTWKKWKEWFRDTYVLSAETGFRRNYTLYPYRKSGTEILTDYRRDDGNTFRVTNPRPEHFEPATRADNSNNPNHVKNKERVFGIVTPSARNGRRGYLFRDIHSMADDRRRKTKELDAEGKERDKFEAGSSVIGDGLFSTAKDANFAVINDRVGDLDLVIFWEAASESLAPDDVRIFDTPPDRVRVYRRPKGSDGKPLDFFVPGSK